MSIKVTLTEEEILGQETNTGKPEETMKVLNTMTNTLLLTLEKTVLLNLLVSLGYVLIVNNQPRMSTTTTLLVMTI